MNSQDLSDSTITLVGGGLVGSLLALILARKGYRVDVFESRPDMRKTDISAGRSINLALANRGIKPLKELGLMDDIKEMLIPMSGRMVHIDGEAANFQQYGQTEQDVIYSISRGQLNSYLMTKAEETGQVQFYFEHRVTDVDFETNTLTLCRKIASDAPKSTEFELTHSFNQLIGTDGANSPVRHAITAATSCSVSEDFLDHSYKELTITEDEKGQHKLDPNALHIWPRGEFMLIALPNLDGSFTVTLFMPNHGYTSFDSIKTNEEIHQFFDHHFIDIKPHLDELVHTFQTNPTGKLATVKCLPWHYQNKALIIGDAAHAIVPFHGQGMNCGFEDCNAFDALLPEFKGSNETNWEALFVSLTEQRKINADAIANMALENYIEMRDSVRQHEFLLKKQFAFQIQQWFPERFTPRYAMVMFEHRPYAQAYEIGKKHEQLLNELSDSYSCASQLTESLVLSLLDKYQL